MEDDESVFGDLEDQCTCWVCFELFVSPVTLHCAHTFCKECVEKVLKKNPSCPFCRKPFGEPIPDVNKEVEGLVAKFLKTKDEKDKKMDEAPEFEQNSMLLHLPEEVIVDILSFLPPKQIGRTAKICKEFRRIADDSWMWRGICQSSFPFCSVDRYGKNWKWCFIARSNISVGWEEGKAGQFEVTTMRGHQNYVQCFSLYRNNVVSGSADNNLKVWKVDSSDPLNTLVGHNGIVNCVQFNEVRIASGSADQSVKLWDTKTGLTMRTINHNGAVNALQFDDAKLISAGDNATIKVWDVRDGSSLMTLNGHTQRVTKVEFDNDRIVSLGGDALKVWDLRSGKLIRDLNDPFSTAPALQMAVDNVISAYTN
eukprot:TRINITY_DN2996_c0_g1_i3.p1 TRINITY_DN2996_c0_g1~~TRINITY_DN2996_c0_g1_i3.p1  ORF type:complete len:385 (+),score=100.61 TRINITY_DN2996_c0_g1_i3:54-1157(+)